MAPSVSLFLKVSRLIEVGSVFQSFWCSSFGQRSGRREQSWALDPLHVSSSEMCKTSWDIWMPVCAGKGVHKTKEGQLQPSEANLLHISVCSAERKRVLSGAVLRIRDRTPVLEFQLGLFSWVLHIWHLSHTFLSHPASRVGPSHLSQAWHLLSSRQAGTVAGSHQSIFTWVWKWVLETTFSNRRNVWPLRLHYF